jgi:hypothetical protein
MTVKYLKTTTIFIGMPKKIILDVDDSLWDLVLKFKIDEKLKNNNETVISLIKKGLGRRI